LPFIGLPQPQMRILRSGYAIGAVLFVRFTVVFAVLIRCASRHTSGVMIGSWLAG
jgi:hypothetical protein